MFRLSSYASGNCLVSKDGQQSQRPEQQNAQQQCRSVYNPCKQKKHRADAGDTHREGKRMSDIPENVDNEKSLLFFFQVALD